ncbi:acetyl-CoA synthetase-like protein [Daldinia decipiens]|uniref:acetyl-CoA synthetase-like protein n=1 Tax=Daldinia decipiens TaxID=326647 RepID=UPI0020C33A35|nr:acetyl-CoA synthetase-like protein [Daldinia decipiens]KAI1662848.1 acetyl-CoA synthetase-like protein [Daldinia decipiens]
MTNDHARVAQWQNDLLPHIVDRLARKPEAIYGLWPVAPDSYDAGFRVVTYSQLANIVNGLAWWLTEQLGPGSHHEVLTYIGPNDVRLVALALASMKSGYVLFLTSPRNSAAAHRSLFDSLKCRTLVTTDPAPPSVSTVLEAVKPRQLSIPTVEELLEKPYPHFFFNKTFEQVRWDPALVIHSSGSTGLPKPLIWCHDTFARECNSNGREPPEGMTSIDSFCHGKRVIAALPPFHGAGLSQYLFNAIPFGNIIIAPAATAIVTAQGLVEALKQAPADVAVLVPSVIAELAQNPELLDYCATHLKLILYIGGDLPQEIGDRIATKVRLRCQWGASEVGIPQQLLPAELGPLDWRYIRFHPCTGAVFEEVTSNNYELIIRRDEALSETQTAFGMLSQKNLEEYRTRDLFGPHPSVPDAWRWRARADDIIVFLNGEKTNPISMEQHVLARNPELSGVLVIGSQRFQAALLIEPVVKPLSTADQAALIERIWPSIEEANQDAPAHARVEKALVLIASDRPLIRAGKGTIQRSASIAQYAVEIDKLYADIDVDLDDEIDRISLGATEGEIASVIRNAVSTVTSWQGIDDSASFFDLGMDSLQALQLTRALRRALRRPGIGLSTVYQNPTIPQLTSALLNQSSTPNDHDLVGSLLATYRELVQQIPVPKPLAPNPTEPVDVILTGSTGTLGTYTLRALLGRPGIGHIFCLNRSQGGGRNIQSYRFAAAGLTADFDNRVTFIQADLSNPSLGVDEETYNELRSRVGLVIHNAWPVNFNLGLQAFRPHLAGLVNLFALSAASAPREMRIVFISSIGAIAGRLVDSGAAPEAVLQSLDSPATNGYSSSKFIAEHLCNTASKHLGIPVTIARVGQVGGAARYPGLWNPSEWLPSLVISSLHLGCLPSDLGPQFSEVDWMPSDLLADVVVDLAKSSKPEGAGSDAIVFNLRNPNTVAWDTLLPVILEHVETRLGKKLEVVQPSTWLNRLEESAVVVSEGDIPGMANAVKSNPAIKLLDFYHNGLWAHEAVPAQPMAVERALAASQTLHDMPPVGDKWMRKWINEWMEA